MLKAYENAATPVGDVVDVVVVLEPSGFVIVKVTTAPATGDPPTVTNALALAFCVRAYVAAPVETVVPRADAIAYCAEPEALYVVLVEFVAAAFTLYIPSGVPAGDVT